MVATKIFKPSPSAPGKELPNLPSSTAADVLLLRNTVATDTTQGVLTWAKRDVEWGPLTIIDEATSITTGVKYTFRAPYAFTLTAIIASLRVEPTTTALLLDLHEAGTTVLSTKLMIDAGEKTSVTATTPYVISDSAIAADAILELEVDQVGTTASGLKVWIFGTRA